MYLFVPNYCGGKGGGWGGGGGEWNAPGKFIKISQNGVGYF